MLRGKLVIMLFCIDFEIGIYPDRIQVTDRRSGRFVDFAAETPFSSSQQLVNDSVYFEHALVHAMRKAISGGFILLDSRARVHAGTAVTLDTAQRAVVCRALNAIGFSRVDFGDETGGLTPAPDHAARAAL